MLEPTSLDGQFDWRRTELLFFLLALFAAVFVYWPGLSGGYIFDDMPFLVENLSLHVTELELAPWARAAMSFPADHQGRWLSMLTLAGNFFLTGSDPFWYKLTNLLIHLLNGILVFSLLDRLTRLLELHFPLSGFDGYSRGVIVVFVAAAWVLLPIQLTAVLYVVQRLESFSNFFVFLGLFVYLGARLKLSASGVGIGKMAAALVFFTGVGLLAKESAILLPLYAACIELVLLSSPASQRVRRRIFVLYGVLLLVPLIVGLLWLFSWIGGETSYRRSFSTVDRLMTQSRVMFHYIEWIILPLPNSLTLYHDDIQVSSGILRPWTTLPSILIILGLGVFALFGRARWPLVSLGIMWFFAGHMLTGTVIPLEMVFEHRNYFPSLGVLLVLASAVLPLLRYGYAKPVAATLGLLCLFYSFNTLLRSLDWSDPVGLAISEVEKRPNSPRARMEFGRALIIAAGDDSESSLMQQAQEQFEICRKLPSSGITCDTAILLLDARYGRQGSSDVWDDIYTKLAAVPPTLSDVGALHLMSDCQLTRRCPHPVQRDELKKAYDLALAYPLPPVLLLHSAARFSNLLGGDPVAAEHYLREVVRLKPSLRAARANLADFLIADGRLEEAEEQLAQLERLNLFGVSDEMIATLYERLETAREEQSAGS